MNKLVQSRLKDIAGLCLKYKVHRLELFGSAVSREQFDPQTSDLDFLVEFQNLNDGEHADVYFGLLEELQQLFGRQVDLVMSLAIKNPYFLESINKNRIELYAA